MTQEALKLALEALELHGQQYPHMVKGYCLDAITAIKEALAQEQEQEPVAWLITDEKINSLQVDSIQRLIDRARHANMTDIKLRINGQDEWFQADWLKHLTRTAPPQRTWVGLTDDDWDDIFGDAMTIGEAIKVTEAKLKQKNGYAEEKNT